MNYLQPKFSVGPPSRVHGCEACIYGDKWGPHAEDCEKVRVHEGFARFLMRPDSERKPIEWIEPR